MWTPPADELIQTPQQPVSAGAWTPPQEELVGGSPAASDDPGLLKSAAAGLMSGVPLAESAVAGIQSLGDKTYEQAHQELENLRDRAWDAHPVAYGAGKTAGLVGTGVATGGTGIPGAIGIGAASGLDAAANVSDMPKAIAEGAVTGGVLGTIGEKVVSPLINKVLPATGKTMLGALGPGKEAIEARLANPEAIDSALSNPESSAMLAKGMNQLDEKADSLSEAARGLLKPDVAPITIANGVEPEVSNVMGAMSKAPEEAADLLTPIFDQLKSRFSQNGIANTTGNESAINALDSQYQRMLSIAKVNGGKLTEEDLKQQIVALQKMFKKSNFDTTDIAATKEALKELSGALNGVLKGSNPAYGEAMKPVADLRSQVTDLKDTFKPDYGEAGQFIGSDSMNSRLGNILNENKSNAQEILGHLKGLTGHDFLENAKNYKFKQAFEKGGNGGAFSPLNLLLGTLGFGAGRATGIPMGGAAGAALGHFAGRAVDGGQIAKNIIDAYLNAGQKLSDSGAQAALQKYGPMLAQAAKAGGTQLAATHFVLATSHPEYQQLVNHLQDNQQ